MRNERPWLASLLALVAFLASVPACRPPPAVEVCIVGESGCVCSDPRLPDGAQDYTLTFEQCRNFIARSPESEQTIRRWVVENCRGN